MGIKKIPISALKEISKKYGQSHVVMMAFDRDTGLTHVVTYGKSIDDCKQAAEGGNFIKKALGWPEKLCNSLPTKKGNEICPLCLGDKLWKNDQTFITGDCPLCVVKDGE